METPVEKKEAAPAGGMMPALISSAVVAVILGIVGFVLAYFVVPSQLAAQMPKPRRRPILTGGD